MKTLRILMVALAIMLSLSPVHALFGLGEPPLSLNVRPSLVGAGYVLVITNTSDEFLHEVSVRAKAPNGSELKSKIVAVTLKPHSSVEVGWMELGMQFDPGDKVYVGAKGYWSDVNGTVPK